MINRARISALLLAAALAVAADAPTDAEWGPIAKALEANPAEAVPQVEAIVAQYPRWVDGHRALAAARLQAGDAKGAWSAARAALAISKTDAAAAALGVQALAALGRHADAFKVADGFTDASDAGGVVAAQAAVAAVQIGDHARTSTYLGAAKARGIGASPVLDFVQAKQAMARQDLAGAASGLEAAVAARPDYHAALYELGRVRTVLALQTPDQALDLLTKAEESFQAACRLSLRDSASRFALGRARLERGKRLIAAGKADEGEMILRTALTALDEGLQMVADNRDAKLWKGDALLRLRRYDEAVPHLRYALNNGATDRALPFNLSLALTKSGKPDEATEILAGVRAQTVDEQLTLAMNAFAQGNWAGADNLLREAMKGLDPEDPKQGPQRLAAIRYLGHCARELAATAPEGSEEREKQLETAANAYKTAGDLNDYPSRHWYMHVQAPRGPLHAFVAGKQSITWNGFWNPPAWKLLAANYGYKVTKGEGIGGALKHGPAHVMLWGLLAFIAFGLFLKGWLLPNGLYGKAKPASSRSSRSPSQGAAQPTSPRTRPASAIARKPGASTVRKPGAKPPTLGGPKTPFND